MAQTWPPSPHRPLLERSPRNRPTLTDPQNGERPSARRPSEPEILAARGEDTTKHRARSHFDIGEWPAPQPRTSSSSPATTRDPRSTRRCARRAAPGSRCGWSSTAAPTAPPRGCSAWRAQDPGLPVIVLPRNSGKGAAVLHGLRRCGARGLHARADDGFRRPASGRASRNSWRPRSRDAGLP